MLGVCRIRKTVRRLPALLACVLLPAAATAQTGQIRTNDPGAAGVEARGWIGIQVDVRMSERSGVTIIGVGDDSPAWQAGLRPNDILLRLNGAETSPETLRSFAAALRPGAPVQMMVLRDGRNHEFQVVAGTLPWPLDGSTAEQIMERIDSVRVRILAMVDSLLTDTAHVMSDDAFRASSAMEEARAIMDERLQGARERSEAVRAALERTRFELREVRFRDTPAPSRTPLERTWDSRRGAARDGRPRPEDRFRPSPPPARFRAPHLVGERFVAGAELERIRPNDSATPSFLSGGGLRVIQVVEGSPAARVGLLPSDVIVAAGDEPIGNLREFRVQLRRRSISGDAELRVVRGDSTLVLRLPR